MIKKLTIYMPIYFYISFSYNFSCNGIIKAPYKKKQNKKFWLTYVNQSLWLNNNQGDMQSKKNYNSNTID
jgi:hypothetical protein